MDDAVNVVTVNKEVLAERFFRWCIEQLRFHAMGF